MKKIILVVIAILVLLVVGNGIYAYLNNTPDTERMGSDPKNASYTVDGAQVALVNGKAETEIEPGPASKVVTQYFGNEATGDLSGDGRPDVAFILTQNAGGSGTYYFVTVALGTDTGYQGTNAVVLGDRIAPQTTEIQNGRLIVNYADRKEGEPMTATPSVGVSKRFEVREGVLLESL